MASHWLAPSTLATALLLVACSDLAVDGSSSGGDAHIDGANAGANSPMASAMTSTPAMARIDAFIEEQAIDTSLRGWKERLNKPPEATFDPGDTYYWELKTNVGDITIELLPDVAPMHVSSTIYLTKLGFYDGIVFHRVIQGFMAQGGCPKGRGTAGPGYQYGGEFDPSVRHDRPGLLSMANAGPNTDGSQFFITFKDTRYLDDKHTIFGKIVDGMETVSTLEGYGSRDNSGKTSKELWIEEARIRVETPEIP